MHPLPICTIQALILLRRIEQKMAGQAVASARRAPPPSPPSSSRPSGTAAAAAEFTLRGEACDASSASGGGGAGPTSTRSNHAKGIVLPGGTLDSAVLPPGLRDGGLAQRHLFLSSPDGINTNLLLMLHGLGVRQ